MFKYFKGGYCVYMNVRYLRRGQIQITLRVQYRVAQLVELPGVRIRLAKIEQLRWRWQSFPYKFDRLVKSISRLGAVWGWHNRASY